MSAILRIKKNILLINNNIQCLENNNKTLKTLYINNTIKLKKEIEEIQLDEKIKSTKELELLKNRLDKLKKRSKTIFKQYYYKDGSIMYKGEWKDGKRSGSGKFYYKSGSIR